MATSITFFAVRNGDDVIVSEGAFHKEEGVWRTTGLNASEVLDGYYSPVIHPVFQDIPDDGKVHYVKMTVEELD